MPDVEPTAPMRVLLIDSNHYTRAGMRALLNEDGRFIVVGGTDRDGVALARRLRPTLIIIDPGRGGGRLDTQLIAELAAAAPESRICIRTSVFDPKAVLRALELGALASFPKADTDAALLHDALALVGRWGAAVTGPGVVGRCRDHQHERGLRLVVSQPDDAGLTGRERQILTLLAAGEVSLIDIDGHSFNIKASGGLATLCLVTQEGCAPCEAVLRGAGEEFAGARAPGGRRLCWWLASDHLYGHLPPLLQLDEHILHQSGRFMRGAAIVPLVLRVGNHGPTLRKHVDEGLHVFVQRVCRPLRAVRLPRVYDVGERRGPPTSRV